MRVTRRERLLSREELRLWRGVVREVKPLRALPEEPVGEPAPAEAREPQPPAATPTPAAPERARSTIGARGLALDPERPSGLDRRSWQRLRRGKLAIEAVLDLHGETQEAAHRRLHAFLAGARRQGRRCVLVVTGKGRTGDGILRHMVPRWLNEPGNRECVIAYCEAQLRHGGSGALYVLIRRTRTAGSPGLEPLRG